MFRLTNVIRERIIFVSRGITVFGQVAKRNKPTLQVRLPNDKTVFTKVTVICTYQTTSCQETIITVANLPTLTTFTIPRYEETGPDIFIQYKPTKHTRKLVF